MLYALFLCTVVSGGGDYCIPSQMWFGPYQTVEECQTMASAVANQTRRVRAAPVPRCFSKPDWTATEDGY